MHKQIIAAIFQKARRIYDSDTSDKFLCLPDTTVVLSPEDIKCLGNLSKGEDIESFEHKADLIFDFSCRMNSPIRGITTRVEEGEWLWDVYDYILKNAILAKGNVDASAEEEYKKAVGILYRDELRTPSEEYEAYRSYRDQYYKKEEECISIHNSLLTASGEEAGILQKNLETAKAQLSDVQRDWSLFGYKEKIESALSVKDNSLVNNPYSFWRKLQDSFIPDVDLNARGEKGFYATTYIFPTNFVDEKWDSILIPGTELAKLYESAPEEIKVICENGNVFSNVKEIHLEYRSVRVERPWFNFDVFKSRLWRLPDEMDQKISYGTGSFVGMFPAYVTALLLMRNGCITYTSGKKVSFSGERQDVSILAYICKKIPTSPDPDETADWAGDFTAREKASLKIQQKTGGKIAAFRGGELVDSGVFEVGDQFRFKALPDDKYILTQWKVNGQFINNEDYTYECTLPEGGLTVIPCWELGEPLNSIQARIDKDTLVSIKNGPATLDMNRYADLCRIKVIAKDAFRDYDNLCAVTLGNFVEILGENAFSNCRKLERITIPAATQTIHKDAFARDTYQQDPIIHVHPANETYTTLNGILVEKRKTLAAKTVTCKCGAKYFFAEEAPAVCPACGCALDGFPVREEVVRVPDVKVPFRVTRQEAEEKVHQFYAKKGFASKEFKKLITQSEIQLQPVYAPYWEWDVQANGSFTIKVYKQDKAGANSGQDVEKQIETHTQDVSIPETKVSIPASRVVKDVVLSTENTYTEAFGFDQAPDGTAFELYKKNAKESQGEERQQIVKKLRDQAKQPYSSSLLKSCEDGIVNFISETGRLLINPIWIGSFVYKEKPYSFYVDGNNGKVTAKDPFPKNWGKIALVVGSILAALALAILAIVYFNPKATARRKDHQPPTVATKALAVTNPTSDGFTIQWEKAKDDVTPEALINYQVFLLSPGGSQFSLVKEEKGITSYTFTDLNPSSTYRFYVVAKDEKGNVLQYPGDNQSSSAQTIVSRPESTTVTRPSSNSVRRPTVTRTVLLMKDGAVSCDGVYDSSAQLKETLDSKLNRSDFAISFDFNSATDGSGSGKTDNILTFDSSYRALGLTMRNKTIHITVNNQRQVIDTGIPIRPGEWQHVDLAYKNGKITINGKEYQVQALNGPGNNVLSTNNYSNGHCFKGIIRNLLVSTMADNDASTQNRERRGGVRVR
jgi:hypothetical protein